MSAENVAYDNYKQWVDNARNDVYGAEATRTVYNVPPDFVPSAGDLDYLTIEHTLTKLIGDKKQYIVTRIDGWPALVSQEEEPQTGKKVTTTRTFHPTEPDIGTNGTARFVESVKQINKRLWMKTVREIDTSITSLTQQEYHPVEYFFPAYLDETTPFVILEIEDNQSIINTIRSSSQRLKVPCLFETTYHTSLPTLSSIFQFKPVDIEIRTGDGNISERNVLTDGATIAVKVKPNLEILFQKLSNGTISYAQYLAVCNGYEVSFDFPASDPSTTEYKALMGTNVLIADDMQRWKFNLYRRIKVWMTMPNLDRDLGGSLGYS